MKKRAALVLAAFVMILLSGLLSVKSVRADGGGYLDVTDITKTSVAIRWDKPSYSKKGAKITVTGYKVYYGTSAKKLKQFGKKLSASSTTKTITGLSAKKKYYFQVKVVIKTVNKASGISAVDETDYLANPLGVYTLPGKVTTLQVSEAEYAKKRVDFEWKAVNPNDSNFGYEYYVKTYDGKKSYSGKVTENAVRLKKIANTTCYFGRVRSFYKLTNRDGTKYCYGEWSKYVPILNNPVVIGANLDNGLLIVAWPEMKGADGYDIYVYTEGWEQSYKATCKALGASSAKITKVNGEKFVMEPGRIYQITILARKNYRGIDYYSPGNTSTKLMI